MGAPGTSYWTGSVLVFNTSSGGMSVYLDDESGTVSFGSYLGKYKQRWVFCFFSLSIILQSYLFVLRCLLQSQSKIHLARHSKKKKKKQSIADKYSVVLHTRSSPRVAWKQNLHKLWLHEKIVVCSFS